ncbi:motility associated factor glycosyltransferase family protein [Magnetospirillum sp. UT-4]|uniref:motility associated factor glycosyltransferase family protein n=1 Tax=Magnetospirillum sp. UT-4 TaxID=2681467 RepID=UPI0013837241|nr:6-hydroxymethylpterin diphosphokinase MptE-like protein [Magnetospirillum sp. UT-4]CAA7618665.1 conserved hypothetical protein [Magnetospirillum sp. UT-4]
MRKSEVPEFTQRSQQALKDLVPGFWAKCEARATDSPLIRDGARVANIDLGELTLYPYNADLWSEEQEAAYWNHPDRLVFSDPCQCNLSEVSIGLLNDMIVTLRGSPNEVLSREPVVDAGYMFVFGIGLGYHIPKLVERACCHRLVLIEPLPEFVHYSTEAIDWSEVLKLAEEKKVDISFITGESPAEICKQLEMLVDEKGNTFFDGSYFYNHYYSWALKESFTLFSKAIKNYYLSTGFFEDEIDMMWNTYGNYVAHDFRIIGLREKVLASPIPAFVVGSGPSIDNDIEDIRRLKDKAIVISCGTGLRVLMANGIRPDLHVEIENVEAIYRAIEEYKRTYDLSGVILVGSSTLRPKVAEYFDELWMFYRTGLSSSAILGKFAKPMGGSAPLVSNSGHALAVSLGFRDIYLFGVDCGKPRHGEAHHSRHTVYFQDNFKDLELLMAADFENDRVLPGNFGGEFVTGWAYDSSRLNMERLQRHYRRNLFNCSNGVRIEGTTPQVAAGIDLSNVTTPKAKVMELLRQQLPLFEREKFLRELDMEANIGHCRDFIKEFTELCEAARTEDKGFRDFNARVKDWVNPNLDRLPGILMMVRGSLFSMVRLGAFLGTRIWDQDSREAFFQDFIGLYLNRCLSMAEKTIALFEEMDARRNEELAKLQQH